MKPHELIARLVKATEKSTLQVATEMHRASFQGTLHKLINGEVDSPSRQTAERIARYFKLPADALYDATLATRIARERGLLSPQAGAKLEVREPEGAWAVQSIPIPSRGRFAPAVESRIGGLDHHQLKALEAVVVAFLDATSPKQSTAKRAS